MQLYGASLKPDHVAYVRKGGSIQKGLIMLTGLRRASAGLFVAFIQMAGAEAADMDGMWSRDDGNARVRIAPCGDKSCATNFWIRDTSKGEAPGDQLIMSLKRSSDTEFSGTAFDPKRGMSYSVDVMVGKQTMKTKGCVLVRLLCKTVGWTEVK
jgi:uncharacterized protein (DUF2147 family)